MKAPPTMRARAVALIAVAALGVGACGESEDQSADLPAAVPAGSAETVPAETSTAKATPSGTATKVKVSKDRTAKPTIPKPSGSPPTELVVQDVVKGTGRAAKVDDMVTVHYVGISHSTGEEFDASWTGGKPVQFALSQGQLIDGWIEGIPGMKVGGRRVLIIPPELGYGAAGNPPSIGPNETLVFVIDLAKVG